MEKRGVGTVGVGVGVQGGMGYSSEQRSGALVRASPAHFEGVCSRVKGRQVSWGEYAAK